MKTLDRVYKKACTYIGAKICWSKCRLATVHRLVVPRRQSLSLIIIRRRRRRRGLVKAGTVQEDAVWMLVDESSAAAAECGHTLSELSPEDAVDDEVDRGVGRDDDVADVEVVEVDLSAGVASLLEGVVEQLVEEGRCLTDNEHQNYNDHHESQVLLLIVATRTLSRKLDGP